MDVIDRLTAMLTIIDYHTIAFLVNTLLGCYFLRNNHAVTKKLKKKKIVIHKAVIKGHNPQHLLQLSSLHFTGDQSGRLKVYYKVLGRFYG